MKNRCSSLMVLSIRRGGGQRGEFFLFGVHPYAAILDVGVGLRCTVVEATEHFVPGVFVGAVVTADESVVQLVHKVAQL
jgi:hypothetical protein